MPRIQHKRGTSANLASVNPTPLAGELVWDSTENAIKMGTGSTAWTSLAYVTATPRSHKSSHATGGSDALSPADIGAAPAASPEFSGYVGINASPSTRRLTVRGSGTADGAVLLQSSSTGTGTSNGFMIQCFGASSDAYVWNFENAPIVFGANNGERMRLTAGGSLGIGRTSPASALDVNGVITVSAGSAAAPAICASGDANTGLAFPAADTAIISTAGVERLRVDSSGRMGIGTGSSTPAGRLEIRNDVTSGNANVRFTNGLNYGYGVQVEFAQPPSNGAAIAQTGAIINGWDSDDNFSLRFRTMAAGTVDERLRVKSTGAVRFVPLASDPATGETGDVYYNSANNKLRVYNGTSWVDLH